MATGEWDAVVIGAGAAGLTVSRELQRAGMRTLCLEARDRIGGRILTARDALCQTPLELGPEFVHGRPPELWELIRTGGLIAYDCFERSLHIKNGKAWGEEDAWLLANRVLDEMQEAARHGEDKSFAEFVEASSQPEEAKQLATGFVEGFNAAHKERIGIASLTQDGEAADKMGGSKSFRILNGYDSVARLLCEGAEGWREWLHLSTTVKKIRWEAGRAEIEVRSAFGGRAEGIRARYLVTTTPLGTLQAKPGTLGAVAFEPEPVEMLAAAKKLCFGQVVRVVLRFREAMWEECEGIGDVGFLLSNEKVFPTWWTTLPVRAPVITGWSAGPHADELLGRPRSEIIEYAVADLSRVTGLSRRSLSDSMEAAYTHDWHTDPFARGAYSYVPPDGLKARAVLAKPVNDTLFFAGEATEQNGHSATVHGAIASGKRAAEQVLRAWRSDLKRVG